MATSSTVRQSRRAHAQHVVDLMRDFAPVEARAMFGGFGVFRDGLMFGLLVDEVLYLKVDPLSVGDFEARGLGPFRYESKGKVGVLRYHQAPAEVYEDTQAMALWCDKAWACAVRARKPARASASAPEPSSRPGTLPNLGPRSAEMLAQAGIHGEDDLRRMGSVLAYARTRAVCPQASLNLLWAIEGALSGRPWQVVAEQDRASLLMALEDVQRHLGLSPPAAAPAGARGRARTGRGPSGP